MHVFPTLQRVERKYPKELVVIGVHSAKFPNEKDSEAVRQAILRHDLEHPVINDADFKIFEAFKAQAWPQFIIISPEGVILHSEAGEISYEAFVKYFDKVIPEFEGKLNRKEMAWKLEKAKEKPGVLAFPGKILATADRLYVADTKHYRILVLDHAGKVLETVGGSAEGNKDGDFAAAKFDEPQGLALRGTSLYVADRENHSIREVDFKGRVVRTIAGTGKQGWRSEAKGPLETALNSPWDLALDGDRLFIAMAGNHQIWVMDLAQKKIGVFSGTGKETLTDGPHERANYSQPSGLSIGNGKLYVADAEVSGVRELDLNPDGRARTLVGTGLFDFGDKDGVGDAALLQHALAVLWHQGKLYVADAYNHKIKTVDPASRLAKTLLGDGKRGKDDGKSPRFHEPSGLAAAGDRMFIADTNNHAIRVYDLKTGEVSTLRIVTR